VLAPKSTICAIFESSKGMMASLPPKDPQASSAWSSSVVRSPVRTNASL